MTPTPEVQERLRQYLLGQLEGAAREEIEKDLLVNEELFEELLVIEDEIIDAYLRGELNGAERSRFEQHFLATPERHEKLRFGRAFNRYLVSSAPAREIVAALPRPAGWGAGTRSLFASPWRIAVLALIVIGIAIGSWRLLIRESDVDKGLVALNAAYREQRPIESRISSLNYAPFSQTRGPGSERVDNLARDRAELALNNAVKEGGDAAAHHALGEVYLAAKRFDDAVAQFELALRSDSKNPRILSDLGAAWLEKGRIDLSGKEPGIGMAELGRSLGFLNQSLELNENLLEALFNRALCKEKMGLLPEATFDWHEYLKRDSSSLWSKEAKGRLEELEQKKPPSRSQLIFDFDRAFQVGDSEAAWRTFCHARSRAGNLVIDNLLNRQLMTAINGQQAEAETAQKELSFAAALELSRTGDRFTTDLIAVYRSADDATRNQLLIARTQQITATQVFNTGGFKQAAQLYSQAKESFTTANDEIEALVAESSMGYCYLRLTYVKTNVAFFERLIHEYEAKHYLSMWAQSLHALSDAQWALNQFTSALASVENGLEIAEDISDYPTIVRCRAQMISVHRIFGDYSTSLTSFVHAFASSNVLPPDPKLTWQLYQQAAYDFYGLGLDSAATAFELNAVEQADGVGVPLLKSRSLAQMAFLYGAQQKAELADQYGELALAEAQRAGDERTRRNMAGYVQLMLGESHLKAGSYHEAEQNFQAALRLYEQLELGAYNYQAQRGSFLSLAALHDDERADPVLVSTLALFETYRHEISNESSRDQFFGANQDIYDAAVNFAFSRKKDPERAFNYVESSRARSLFEMMNTGARIIGSDQQTQLLLEANTVSLDSRKIQQALPLEVQLLEYAVLEDKIVMWVIRRDSQIRVAESATGAAQIEQSVNEFLAELTRNRAQDEAIRTRGRELYRILVKPIEDSLDPNRQLCIVSDKSLNYLPFAALVSDDGSFLIQRFAVTRAPSATVFVQLTEQARKRGEEADEHFLSVGDPGFDRSLFKSLDELPGAAAEAKQVASYYRSPVLLIREAASARQVKSAMVAANVIHFATHALADERSPLLSKLLLTPDPEDQLAQNRSGVLEASEIYQLDLSRTRLVVLSACRTAVERSYHGEGAIGLARPFIAGNVPLVVASLWPVESEAARDLMIRFHRDRKQHTGGTVEALREAQLAAIEEQKAGSLRNYDWAAFTVIGGYATF